MGTSESLGHRGFLCTTNELMDGSDPKSALLEVNVQKSTNAHLQMGWTSQLVSYREHGLETVLLGSFCA